MSPKAAAAKKRAGAAATLIITPAKRVASATGEWQTPEPDWSKLKNMRQLLLYRNSERCKKALGTLNYECNIYIYIYIHVCTLGDYIL
jgi:hypothetical protein